jgi:AMP-binding enzyme
MHPGWEVLVKAGVGTGASMQADPGGLRTSAAQRAITEAILELADGAGYRAALIDAVPSTPQTPHAPQTSGSLRTAKKPPNHATLGDPDTDGIVTTWQQFANMVRAAARGLARRGLQDTDVVGVFVRDAASYAVAVHAVRAAGAIAWSIRPGATVADIAAQLKACRARLLITSGALAELAVQAAERSLVRQVFAIGEVPGTPGTTPFSSLLEAAEHGHARQNGSARTASGYLTAQLPELGGLGPADEPGPRLTPRDVVVAAPPCGAGEAYQSLLDMALMAGATIVAAPLPQVTAATRAYRGTAAIVPLGTRVPALPAERIFTVA